MPATTTSSSELPFQFICHDGEFSADILDEISDWFSASDRQNDISRDLTNNPYRVDMVAWVASIAEGWDPALKTQVLAALPYDKPKATALRDYLDRQSDEVRFSVAAFLKLGNQFGLFHELNGNQIRSYARLSWYEKGLQKHPVPFIVTCPQCQQAAACKIVLHPSGYVVSWKLTCEHCAYHEDLDYSRTWRLTAAAKYPSLSELADDFQSILTRQGNHWGQSFAGPLLERIGEWLPQLEENLKIDASALHRALSRIEVKRGYGGPNKGWTIRHYGHGSFELRSNILQGYVSPAHKEQGVGCNTFRAMDRHIDEVPDNRLERHIVEVPDVAFHWREQLNDYCALLTDALATKDIARAAAAVTVIAYAIDTVGLVSNVEFRLLNPSQKILLLAEKNRFKGASSQNLAAQAGTSVPLSEFLAKGLAQHGVSADEVAALLQSYWGAQRS